MAVAEREPTIHSVSIRQSPLRQGVIALLSLISYYPEHTTIEQKIQLNYNVGKLIVLIVQIDLLSSQMIGILPGTPGFPGAPSRRPS